MKVRFLLPFLVFAPVAANAQPAEFLKQYQGMANTGSLELEFCYIGEHGCVWHHAQAWGQVCDPHMARDMGLGRSGTVDGGIPMGSHYAGWRCATDNPGDQPPDGKGGTADEWPDMPEMPAWTKDPENITKAGSNIVSWAGSFGQGTYVMPRHCDLLNEKGHPIKSWWARPDGSCVSADAP